MLKMHKIPAAIEKPSNWLDENGFPIRGIVSGRGAPTERLSGFVDYHLQSGMKNLDTFLQDTKHTLQIIQEVNDKVDAGELSLEGVALVSLDVDSMYNNMSEELGTSACKEFLENRRQSMDENENLVSTNSILDSTWPLFEKQLFHF